MSRFVSFRNQLGNSLLEFLPLQQSKSRLGPVESNCMRMSDEIGVFRTARADRGKLVKGQLAAFSSQVSHYKGNILSLIVSGFGTQICYS
jgi:hypothetical protein